MDMQQAYGVKKGQIYLAADESKCGHIVVDAHTFGYCGDVLVRPFTPNGFDTERRLDAFKLTRVRYSLTSSPPSWMPAPPDAGLLSVSMEG